MSVTLVFEPQALMRALEERNKPDFSADLKAVKALLKQYDVQEEELEPVSLKAFRIHEEPQRAAGVVMRELIKLNADLEVLPQGDNILVPKSMKTAVQNWCAMTYWKEGMPHPTSATKRHKVTVAKLMQEAIRREETKIQEAFVEGKAVQISVIEEKPRPAALTKEILDQREKRARETLQTPVAKRQKTEVKNETSTSADTFRETVRMMREKMGPEQVQELETVLAHLGVSKELATKTQQLVQSAKEQAQQEQALLEEEILVDTDTE